MLRKELAGVSRLWRDLILETPSFWGDIALTFSSKVEPESLMTQLKRSRECPLDSTICYLPHAVAARHALDLLVPTTDRWRSPSLQVVAKVVSNVMHKLNRFERCFNQFVGHLLGLYGTERHLILGRRYL